MSPPPRLVENTLHVSQDDDVNTSRCGLRAGQASIASPQAFTSWGAKRDRCPDCVWSLRAAQAVQGTPASSGPASREEQRAIFPGATWFLGDVPPVGRAVDLGLHMGIITGEYEPPAGKPNQLKGWWTVAVPALRETGDGSCFFALDGTGAPAVRVEYPPSLKPWDPAKEKP